MVADGCSGIVQLMFAVEPSRLDIVAKSLELVAVST